MFDMLQTSQDVLSREKDGIRGSKEGQEAVLLLTVIQHLEFTGLFGICVVALTADGRVSNGNGACHGKCLVGGMDNVCSDLHHGDVAVYCS